MRRLTLVCQGHVCYRGYTHHHSEINDPELSFPISGDGRCFQSFCHRRTRYIRPSLTCQTLKPDDSDLFDFFQPRILYTFLVFNELDHVPRHFQELHLRTFVQRRIHVLRKVPWLEPRQVLPRCRQTRRC